MASERYRAALEDAKQKALLSRLYRKSADGHWMWVGYIRKCSAGMGWYPYADVRRKGTHMLAHRVAYELYKEPIPEGRRLWNTCGVTTCVNPDHWTLILDKGASI